MASVYKFQISQPINDTLARNRITNTVYFEHVVGGQSDSQLLQMCTDLAALYQSKYGDNLKEVMVKAYDTDAVPNYPRATKVLSAGTPWPCALPPEIALCLSFAGTNRGNKRERGRIYLMPQIRPGVPTVGLRPASGQMNWALSFFTDPNSSFPDIGGVDWKFGIWSTVGKQFTQAQQAWCNDDWDHQRRRSTRESTRVSATREG